MGEKARSTIPIFKLLIRLHSHNSSSRRNRNSSRHHSIQRPHAELRRSNCNSKNPQWISQAREFRDRRPARKASWQEDKVARYPRMEQVQEELLTSPRSYGVSPRGESYEDMILRRLRSADIGGGENHMPRSPRAVQSPKTVMSNIPRMPAEQSPRDRYAAPMSPSSRSTPLHYADCATESSRYAPPRSPLNMLNSHLPSSYNSVRPAMGMHGAGGAPWFRGAPMHHQGPMYM